MKGEGARGSGSRRAIDAPRANVSAGAWKTARVCDTLRLMKAALAVLLLATLPALPAAADTPMSAAEFEAYVTGKTLHFSFGGVSYGVEAYHPGREVRWSFLDDDCKEGRWYPAGEQICFVYEDGTGPQCWTFFREPEGLRARFAGDPPGTELYETRTSEEPMQCPGPDLGV